MAARVSAPVIDDHFGALGNLGTYLGRTIYNIVGSSKLWHVYSEASQAPVAGPFCRREDTVRWAREAREADRVNRAKKNGVAHTRRRGVSRNENPLRVTYLAEMREGPAVHTLRRLARPTRGIF
jgi:hypothetical protein